MLKNTTWINEESNYPLFSKRHPYLDSTAEEIDFPDISRWDLVKIFPEQSSWFYRSCHWWESNLVVFKLIYDPLEQWEHSFKCLSTSSLFFIFKNLFIFRE